MENTYHPKKYLLAINIFNSYASRCPDMVKGFFGIDTLF
ncbi:Uncharacterised protein [Alloiococcus otitis]|uniref:Uncharacterized protein n=1 Tax=Alloiococcus otitis ATCC 51267 TaxID=883081 RepID=K9ECA0_9LACT|nr:hypothetical protein HMPREF9698_00963 [Alloiococcus otitis ATCC 51267]SUU81432.1 Uncharacterised protein [Alloiococcus otitis]